MKVFLHLTGKSSLNYLPDNVYPFYKLSSQFAFISHQKINAK